MNSLLSFLGWYALVTILLGMAATVVVGVPAILIVVIFQEKD